ncbi:hypothetical protein [Tepidibacter aestuarii]|nr:hypothetical protein [Tepidibacter aestuarii]CAH2215254.1 conserved protein of unknown function [Tepidibacter aestuarii]
MNRDIELIKSELESLCKDFVDMLDNMRDKDIINEEEYIEYTSKKFEFLK